MATAKPMAMVKLKPQILFDLLVLLFFVYLVWEANEWKLQARLYPWVIGIPMVILAVIHLAMELRGVTKSNSSESTPVDFQFAKGIDPLLARWRTISCFSWILGFLVGVWLVGFSIWIPWISSAAYGTGWLLQPTIIVIFLMIFTTLGYSLYNANKRKEKALSEDGGASG